MITENAKNIVARIAIEARLADQRVADGHIKPHQANGAILERLSAAAKRNVNMKTFLTTTAFIPEEDDTRNDVEWAEDRRESKDHVVNSKMAKPENVRPDPDAICEHPMPNERIC